MVNMLYVRTYDVKSQVLVCFNFAAILPFILISCQVIIFVVVVIDLSSLLVADLTYETFRIQTP